MGGNVFRLLLGVVIVTFRYQQAITSAIPSSEKIQNLPTGLYPGPIRSHPRHCSGGQRHRQVGVDH